MVATNSAHFITLFLGSFREKTKSIHLKSFFFGFYGLKNSTNFRIFAWNLTFFPYFSHHSTLKKFTCPSKSCFFMTLPIEFLQKISKYTSHTFWIFFYQGAKTQYSAKIDNFAYYYTLLIPLYFTVFPPSIYLFYLEMIVMAQGVWKYTFYCWPVSKKENYGPLKNSPFHADFCNFNLKSSKKYGLFGFKNLFVDHNCTFGIKNSPSESTVPKSAHPNTRWIGRKCTRSYIKKWTFPKVLPKPVNMDKVMLKWSDFLSNFIFSPTD